MRFCLTRVICGCTVMTYGPRERGGESRAAESCSSPSTADRATARSRRAIGARLFHFSPASLSIPAASAKAERAGPDKRAQAGVHGQASTELDSARAVVRICQKDLNQRSREPGVIGAPAARRRSWLSRGQSRHARFGWNIDLTACRLTNWLRLINCWYPIGGERLERHPLNHSILIRR
jgi:hypothetical protein